MIKYSQKKHKTFNAETDEKNDFQLSELSSENEDESDKKIATLSKKIISKFLDLIELQTLISSYITDQLWLFKDSLMQIHQVIIKIEKERLYADYCDTVTIQDQVRNFILLYYILYISKLDINLLSEKWMCKKDLWRSFDTWELYMHNENDKLMLKTSQKDDIYVVKYIAKKLDEFTLLTICLYVSNVNIRLHTLVKSLNLWIQICQFKMLTVIKNFLCLICKIRIWHFSCSAH